MDKGNVPGGVSMRVMRVERLCGIVLCIVLYRAVSCVVLAVCAVLCRVVSCCVGCWGFGTAAACARVVLL
jgi:hypothetical protein